MRIPSQLEESEFVSLLRSLARCFLNGRIISRPPPRIGADFSIIFLRAATLMATLVSRNQFGAEIPPTELTDPGKAYKEYQASAPPVSNLVYEQSYIGGKRGDGVVLAEGAIQPTGYFLRYISNSPLTTNMVVWGLSSEQEWEYCPDFLNASYGPHDMWTNWQSSMNFYRLQDIQTVARLGLPRPYAGDDNFTWTSQTDFVFEHPWDHYVGSIKEFDTKKRPSKVEYHSADKNAQYWRKCNITYEYDADKDFPPIRFVVDVQTRNSYWATTNILHGFVVGSDDHITNGYHLKDFLPSSAEMREIFFMSNHDRYTVRPDGSMVKYKYLDQVATSAHPIRYTAIFVLLALSITTGAYFLMLRRREKP